MAGSGFEFRGYAAFLQNAGFFIRVGSQSWHPGLVCDAPTGHGIQHVVGDWYWTHGGWFDAGNAMGGPVSETRWGPTIRNANVPFALIGQRLPAKGSALGTISKRIRVFSRNTAEGGPGARFEARGCVDATVRARLFRAVVADGFDGAAGEGFFAEGAFFLGFRLFIQVGMATVLIAFEVRGCGLPAEVTVDALVIDVVGSLDVLGVAVVFVGHGGRWMDE